MSELSPDDPLSAVAHDLRQPLQAVLLYLDALDRRTEREDAREILGKARLAANALSDQLNALSLHNKLRRGEIKPYVEAFTLREIAGHIAKAAPNITPVLAESDRSFETDLGLLTQILRALIENAQRHGGGLSAFDINQAGGDTLFILRDSGGGIPEADRERIFQPLVKLEAGGEGLGLGLSNAQAIAALLGGAISVEDNPGDGAVFTLRLPSSVR